MYHAFGVYGYLYHRTEYVGGEIHFTVTQAEGSLRCSACRSRRVIRRGGRERRFRGLPIGSRRVWIVLKVPRLECKACGVVRQAAVSPFYSEDQSVGGRPDTDAQGRPRHLHERREDPDLDCLSVCLLMAVAKKRLGSNRELTQSYRS